MFNKLHYHFLVITVLPVLGLLTERFLYIWIQKKFLWKKSFDHYRYYSSV